MQSPQSQPAELHCRLTADGTLAEIVVAGHWETGAPKPTLDAAEQSLRDAAALQQVRFTGIALADWDSSLIVALSRLVGMVQERGLETDVSALPHGVQGLLRLAFALPEREGARRVAATTGLLARVGHLLLDVYQQAHDYIRFLGEVVLALLRLLRGKASFRGSDLLLFIQETGVGALPIVTLISLLVGVILAFVGALQLELFGAEIYVADLVALGMTREMGAMMTAIIMAGRSGAAFSAQLGSMQVNEEVDAYTTMGISAVEFLVLPRVLALSLMMPLLCVYADILGVIGGMASTTVLFDISLAQYLDQTRNAVGIDDILIGLGKSLVFGVLVALAGCLKGIQCGRSSAAVGQATTQAVVLSIVSIVVADSFITVVVSILGI